MSFQFLSQNRKTTAVSLFALNLLLLLSLAAIAPRRSTYDTAHYLKLAESLSRGAFGLETASGFEPEGVRSFGYPIFILFCHSIFGKNDFGIILVQAALYLVSLFLIWQLIKETFGEKTSFIFLALSSVYPFIAYLFCQLSVEGVSTFLIALAAYVLDYSIRRNRASFGFAVAGILLAATMYFRSNLFPLPFFVALVFFVWFPKLRKPAMLLVCSAILTFLPASIYNYRNFNAFSPTPVYGGAQASLWMATWHARLGTDAIIRYIRQIEISPTVRSSGMLEQMGEANRKIGVREDMFPLNMGFYPDNATRARAQEEYGRAALENIKETPAVFAKSCLINVFRMWFSAHIGYENIPVILRFYLLLIGFTVFLLGFIGLILALKNSIYSTSPFAVFSATTIIFHSITLCWTHTEARYTIPARFFLLAFAAFAIFSCFQAARNYFSRRML